MALFFEGEEILTLRFEGELIETLRFEGEVVARKPTITTQPAGDTITDAESKTLSVVADGLGSTMSYQWYKSDGSAISGATGTSYTFNPASTGSFGFYCRVTGFGGYTQTDTATVIVESAVVAPVITTNPASGTIAQFENYTASIVVDWGGETGTIVWFLDDTAQADSNSTTYTFTEPSLGSHSIRAEATNSKGTDVSENGTVDVEPNSFETTNESWTMPLYAGTYYGFSSRLGGDTHGSITPDVLNDIPVIGITYQDQEDEGVYHDVIMEFGGLIEGDVTIGYGGNSVTAASIPTEVFSQVYFESPPAWLLTMLKDTVNSHVIIVSVS